MSKSIVLLILLSAASIHGADYWPTTPGSTFQYVNPSGELLDVEIRETYEAGQTVRHGVWKTAWGGCWSSETMFTDEVGAVYLVRGDHMCAGGVDPDWINYAPSLKLLDRPLEPQKPTLQIIEINGTPEYVLIEVSGPVTLTTPAGTFETMMVDVNPMFGAPYLGRTYWLHRNLGPVKIEPGEWELVGWTGVVANHEVTWSDVKTMFK